MIDELLLNKEEYSLTKRQPSMGKYFFYKILFNFSHIANNLNQLSMHQILKIILKITKNRKILFQKWFSSSFEKSSPMHSWSQVYVQIPACRATPVASLTSAVFSSPLPARPPPSQLVYSSIVARCKVTVGQVWHYLPTLKLLPTLNILPSTSQTHVSRIVPLTNNLREDMVLHYSMKNFLKINYFTK